MACFVYILICADGTLYTGITNDISQRVYAHNYLKSGAKYTKSRRPVALAHLEEHDSIGAALKREAQIKKLSRIQKLRLLTL